MRVYRSLGWPWLSPDASSETFWSLIWENSLLNRYGHKHNGQFPPGLRTSINIFHFLFLSISLLSPNCVACNANKTTCRRKVTPNINTACHVSTKVFMVWPANKQTSTYTSTDIWKVCKMTANWWCQSELVAKCLRSNIIENRIYKMDWLKLNDFCITCNHNHLGTPALLW